MVGTTFRVADYWVRTGAFGDRLRGLGSGARRRWTDADLEKLYVLSHLLGERTGQPGGMHVRRSLVEAGLDAVGERRVDPAGELLVLVPPDTAYRIPRTGPLPDVVCAAVLHLQAFEDLEPLGRAA